MRKKYYCDFCAKRLQNTPAIIRKHNEGLPHFQAVQEHYQKYKDQRQILTEERQKPPCLRAAKNQCKFGAACRNSHYSAAQLNEIEARIRQEDFLRSQPPQIAFKSIEEFLERRKIRQQIEKVQFEIYWKYPEQFKDEDLPPSLRRLDPKRLK